MSDSPAIDSENQSELGDLLLALRKDRRWSQAKLGEELGTTQQTVARWESGDQPSDNYYAALGRVLGLDPSRISTVVDEGSHPPKQRSSVLGSNSGPGAHEVAVLAVSRRIELFNDLREELPAAEVNLLLGLLRTAGSAQEPIDEPVAVGTESSNNDEFAAVVRDVAREPLVGPNQQSYLDSLNARRSTGAVVSESDLRVDRMQAEILNLND